MSKPNEFILDALAMIVSNSTSAQPETVSSSDLLAMVEAHTIDKFRIFSKLPLELRMDIWECVLPESRVVTIEQSRRRHVVAEQDRAVTIPTELLHTNQESRSVALKVYEAFQGGWERGPVYFDFKKDVLCTRDFSAYNPIGLGPGSLLDAEGMREWQTKLQHLRLTNWDVLASDYGILQDMNYLQSIELEVSRFLIVVRSGNWERAKALTLACMTSKVAEEWRGPKDKVPTVTLLHCICISQ
ncbi:hypothetical protein DL98DRAFT_631408 [Cadophora sp. DSE1049]|nr:hypothetical protein DL98DRAFT_631408 [Cadophora sp. DSE1049]